MPWYIKTQNGEKGPVPSKDLLKLARSGQLKENDLVRRHNKTRWASAHKVQGLFHGPIPVAAIPSINETEGAETTPENTKPVTIKAPTPVPREVQEAMQAREERKDDIIDALPEITDVEVQEEEPANETDNPLASLANAAGDEIGVFQEGYAEEIYDSDYQYDDDFVETEEDEEEKAYKQVMIGSGGFEIEEEDLAYREEKRIEDYNHEAWDELEDRPEQKQQTAHASSPRAKRTQRTQSDVDNEAQRTQRSRKKKYKDHRLIAQVLLWLNAASNLITPPIMTIWFFASDLAGTEIEEAISLNLLKGLIAGSWVIFGGTGLLLAFAADGIGKGKQSGRIIGIIYFVLNILGLNIFGVLGLWALLSKGSVRAMERAAEREYEKRERKEQRKQARAGR